MPSQQYEIASVIFQRLRASFPSLAMSLDENPEHMDLTFDIPQQDGLQFDVHLNLQNVDELHLCAEGFWCSWFPCTDPERAEAFFDAVSGLLSGHFRILEHWRGTRLAKAQLQRPVGDGWKTVATSAPFPPFLWPRKTFKVVRNVLPLDRRRVEETVPAQHTSIDSEELERIRAEVKRLISRSNLFILYAFVGAAVIVILCAIFFDPLPTWALLTFAFASAIVGQLLWHLSTPDRPHCPACGTDWTHPAFLKWDACRECGLTLSPQSEAN